MAKINLTIRLEAELAEKLKKLAAVQGASRNAIIIDILYGFVEKNAAAIKDFEDAAKKFYEKVKW